MNRISSNFYIKERSILIFILAWWLIPSSLLIYLTAKREVLFLGLALILIHFVQSFLFGIICVKNFSFRERLNAIDGSQELSLSVPSFIVPSFVILILLLLEAIYFVSVTTANYSALFWAWLLQIAMASIGFAAGYIGEVGNYKLLLDRIRKRQSSKGI